MTESQPIARQIQQLEAVLNILLEGLRRGDLPMNLQPVSQVFDQILMAELPRLELAPEQLIAAYNEFPSLLSAYAIEANITAAAFQSGDRGVFGRELKGNYWILPLPKPPDCAWLLPNPQKKLPIDLIKSLSLAFDFEAGQQGEIANLALTKPTLLQQLPTEPATWQVVQRGQLGTLRQPRPDGASPNLQLEINRLQRELKAAVTALEEKNAQVNGRVDSLRDRLRESNDSTNSRLDKFRETLRDLMAFTKNPKQ
jgi:hypothetical protein